MPQKDSLPSSGYLTSLSCRHAILSSLQPVESLSAFDYEQMCLALVIVAKRIQELKALESETSERYENQ